MPMCLFAWLRTHATLGEGWVVSNGSYIAHHFSSRQQELTLKSCTSLSQEYLPALNTLFFRPERTNDQGKRARSKCKQCGAPGRGYNKETTRCVPQVRGTY